MLGDRKQIKIGKDQSVSNGVLTDFLFYNYPTAIELELHKGLDKFNRVIKGDTYSYGEELRTYFRILFDF